MDEQGVCCGQGRRRSVDLRFFRRGTEEWLTSDFALRPRGRNSVVVAEVDGAGVGDIVGAGGFGVESEVGSGVGASVDGGTV